MRRFFFNFRGDGDEASDEVGCEFASLELAYLDAYRSMVHIGADLLLEQKDPSRQRIEIAGEDGTVLMILFFDEVFRRRRTTPASSPHGAGIKRQIESSRRLREDIRLACAEARASVAAARATLGRAKEGERVRSLQGW